MLSRLVNALPPAALPGAKLLKKFDQNFYYKTFLRGPGAGVRRTRPVRDYFDDEDFFDNYTFTWNLHLPPLAEKSPWPPEAK